MSKYNAKSIKALTDRDHLLKRMSLTFGDEGGTPEYPYSTQKSVAIREIIDNAEDEVSLGHASKVFVKFSKDGSVTVQDDGRGLPVDIGQDAHGNPANGIFMCLGIIKSGGKFSNEKRYSKGLNGVGSSSTIATSSRADVEVYRDNKIYKLSFKDGKPGQFEGEGPFANFIPYDNNVDLLIEKDNRPKEEKSKYKTGTKVKVWLNDKLFKSKYPIHVDDLIARLRGSAYLLANIQTEVINEHRVDENGNYQHEFFHFDNGLAELVEANQTGAPIVPITLIKCTAPYKETVYDNDQAQNVVVDREAVIELGFTYDNGYNYNMESFVNTIRTRLGGSHEQAFESALVSVFGEKIKSIKGLLPKEMELPIVDDFKEGLTVVLSAYVSEPEFTSQSKEKFGGKDALKPMINALKEALSEFVDDKKNSSVVSKICEKVVQATIIRQTAKAERDLQRVKKTIEKSNKLPDKLLNCIEQYTPNSELYIAEGDSAASAVKAARLHQTQAILPIKGKIINSNKAFDLKTVLESEEVKNIIQALDGGIGSEFDLSGARYQRVVLATDADADGGAISCLLIMLFWHLFRPIILEGNLFQLQTPLFVVNLKNKKKGHKDKYYALSDRERDSILEKLHKDGLTKKDYTISRIKGLGECNEEVLFETGLNPETRTIKRIVVSDVEKAEKMLDIALGSDTEIRKEWIDQKHEELKAKGIVL